MRSTKTKAMEILENDNWELSYEECTSSDFMETWKAFHDNESKARCPHYDLPTFSNPSLNGLDVVVVAVSPTMKQILCRFLSFVGNGCSLRGIPSRR